MSQNFIKNKEDFTCENCGVAVAGNGYTNHCPRCPWSKHVDINPGDRAETCGGLMKPVSLEQKAGEFVLIHECARCGQKRPNRTATNDQLAAFLPAC